MQVVRRPVHRLWWIGIACLVVTLCVVVRGYQRAAEAANERFAAAPAAVNVSTIIANQQNLPIYLSGIGNVQAALSVTVRVRVDGQLQKVAFKEGQAVHAGDLLAQIDPAPYQAALQAAQAQQAKDEASYKNSLVDLKRYAELIKQDSIAQQTYDTQIAMVASLKAAVGIDRAQGEAARVNLAYTTIHSPITGLAGMRLIDPGNIVRATDTTGLVVINQIDPISVVFTLPEQYFQAINQAVSDSGTTPLTVLAYAREDNSLLGRGQLLLINNQIDTSTGTVQLKATFPNPGHKLWPGQFVNVHVITSVKNVVAIPAAAVQRGNAGLYAFVVKPDETAVMQPITVALTQDGKAVISSGIRAGTRVVVDGQYRLRPGAKVTESNARVVAAGGSVAAPDTVPPVTSDASSVHSESKGK